MGKTTVLTEIDLCPNCGSLEGLIESRDLPDHGVVRSFDWASGSVAPWRTRDGAETYSTSPDVALDALKVAGISEGLGCVIDLGCGDAQILRAAASTFKIRCVGLELDSSVISEAQ